MNETISMFTKFPKWTFVIGKTGSGKIAVIEVIWKIFTLQLGSEAVMDLASIAIVTTNIKNKAFHSFIQQWWWTCMWMFQIECQTQ